MNTNVRVSSSNSSRVFWFLAIAVAITTTVGLAMYQGREALKIVAKEINDANPPRLTGFQYWLHGLTDFLEDDQPVFAVESGSDWTVKEGRLLTVMEVSTLSKFIQEDLEARPHNFEKIKSAILTDRPLQPVILDIHMSLTQKRHVEVIRLAREKLEPIWIETERAKREIQAIDRRIADSYR